MPTCHSILAALAPLPSPCPAEVWCWWEVEHIGLLKQRAEDAEASQNTLAMELKLSKV